MTFFSFLFKNRSVDTTAQLERGAGHVPPKALAKEAKRRKRERKLLLEETLRQKDDDKIRLNLGCGDKILPGFVNVDIAPARKDLKPDVICDLRKLKFENDYADEILSVHVVEHFYNWEIQEVLHEWQRVLKPGGTISLECPNLLSAAEELVRKPELAQLGGKDWATTMFVFYGDPSWKDSLMCHRWGYTPQSLMNELEDNGFINVRQELALFKKGDPRDMRIVGEKRQN